MPPYDSEPEHDPFFDDDEVVDYLLYKEMEKETGRQPGTGCLGGLLLVGAVPAGIYLLHNLLA